MTNAKTEFLDHITTETGNRTVRCAIVTNTYDSSNPHERTLNPPIVLPVGYTSEDLDMFLEQINFDYNSSFGIQYVFGTIWYTDGVTWSSRGEDDGSEWWDFNEVPAIPEYLMGDTSTKL